MLIENKLYYIHIPRTGGRYVKNLFKKNNYNYLFDDYYMYLRDTLKRKDIEFCHFEYPYFFKLTNNKTVDNFTVVRDPIDRFRSCLKATLLKDKIEITTNNVNEILNNLKLFINNQIISETNNWFVPQVNFISYETKLWKYEDGLGKNFRNWLFQNFNLKLEIYDTKYDIANYDEKIDLEFTSLQKDNIKNYYYKDYKIIYG